jgi:membrane-bound lytic murein transglycosylase B
LSRTEATELQERLTARGFDTGGTDGVIGANTIAAIRAFQQASGMTPDGFATASLLQQLR